MRCAIYRRVSTDRQREEGFSLEAQESRLRAYVESQGWTVYDDYADEGYSAKNTNRPYLQKMLKDMSEDKFDVILVYKLDRFVRSVVDLHNMLQEMEKFDVKFKSCTEIFDTTTATGRMFITIIATLAQWERETIGERVFDVSIKNAENGHRPGTKTPFGYKTVNKKLYPEPQNFKYGQYIYERIASVSADTVAKELNAMGSRNRRGNPWDGKSIEYIARNPINVGIVRWNYRKMINGNWKLTNEAVQEKIDQEDFIKMVPPEQYNLVQKILDSRKGNGKTRTAVYNAYPYSGILRCKRCGHKITGHRLRRKSGRIERTYKCNGRRKYGVCDLPQIPEESMDIAFKKSIKLSLDNPDISKKITISLSEAEIESKLKEIQNKKERANELYIDGQITRTRFKDIQKKLIEEEMSLVQIAATVEEEVSQEDLIEFLTDLENQWLELGYDSQKQALTRIFETIEVDVTSETKSGGRYSKAVLAEVSITDFAFRD